MNEASKELVLSDNRYTIHGAQQGTTTQDKFTKYINPTPGLASALKVLDISEDDAKDSSKLKTAHRKAALIVHPDKHRQDLNARANMAFSNVTQAYEFVLHEFHLSVWRQSFTNNDYTSNIFYGSSFQQPRPRETQYNCANFPDNLYAEDVLNEQEFLKFCAIDIIDFVSIVVSNKIPVRKNSFLQEEGASNATKKEKLDKALNLVSIAGKLDKCRKLFYLAYLSFSDEVPKSFDNYTLDDKIELIKSALSTHKYPLCIPKQFIINCRSFLTEIDIIEILKINLNLCYHVGDFMRSEQESLELAKEIVDYKSNAYKFLPAKYALNLEVIVRAFRSKDDATLLANITHLVRMANEKDSNGEVLLSRGAIDAIVNQFPHIRELKDFNDILSGPIEPLFSILKYIALSCPLIIAGTALIFVYCSVPLNMSIIIAICFPAMLSATFAYAFLQSYAETTYYEFKISCILHDLPHQEKFIDENLEVSSETSHGQSL